MTEEEILAEFRAADALLEGHFVLSSGLHSPRYLQCARVLMDPSRASRLASALARTLPLEAPRPQRTRGHCMTISPRPPVTSPQR